MVYVDGTPTRDLDNNADPLEYVCKDFLPEALAPWSLPDQLVTKCVSLLENSEALLELACPDCASSSFVVIQSLCASHQCYTTTLGVMPRASSACNQPRLIIFSQLPSRYYIMLDRLTI